MRHAAKSRSDVNGGRCRLGERSGWSVRDRNQLVGVQTNDRRNLYGTHRRDTCGNDGYLDERHAASQAAVAVAMRVLAGDGRAVIGIRRHAAVIGVRRVIAGARYAGGESRQHRHEGNADRKQIAQRHRRVISYHGREIYRIPRPRQMRMSSYPLAHGCIDAYVLRRNAGADGRSSLPPARWRGKRSKG